MRHYEVKMTVQAEEHILEYAEYIKSKLLNPQAAIKFVNDMQTAIRSLSQMPQRNPLTDEKPWREMGVHTMTVRGYIVYYWIEDTAKTVHVTAIVYGKRNQAEQLDAMDFK